MITPAYVSRSAIFSAFQGPVRVWNSPRVPVTNRAFLWAKFPAQNYTRRRLHSSTNGAFNGGQDWDGLVYSIMANLRGQFTHGPECFYHSQDSNKEPDSNLDPPDYKTVSRSSSLPRDMRDEVPLNLDSSYLGETGKDFVRRLQYLAREEKGSTEYRQVMKLAKLLIRLGDMKSSNPKLELEEYIEIWTTIRDGTVAANELSLPILSLNEAQQLKLVKWKAECLFGIAAMNAAVRRLQGTKREVEGDGALPSTFEGDMRSIGFKIHGLLLDSKDFWPVGKRWFSIEEEERILEVVWRVYKEGKKRA